jgi:purine-binding chemotaxis protein CheW
MGASNRYIKNLGKAVDGVKLLLDCEKLLTADEINNLASII